ncbi:hypothetical protein AYO44_03890 [Planctomycetaceae bacterium SCGC AG-212-F19]|nr:hypothetical protein AYO44_03890 [Planctomycetaceae bacterium SCGC AG-212-F19]
MLRGLIALVGGIVLLAVVGVAIADEVKGKVEKVDGTKITVNKVTVEAKDAKVTKGKKDAAITDVKEGADVTVTYEKKGDDNVASKIAIGKGK